MTAILAIFAILALSAAVDASSITVSPQVGCCEPLKEEYFCLYAHQIWAASPNPTDVPYVSLNTFGGTRADDWLILNGNGTNAKLVGRAQGHHSLYSSGTWSTSLNIIFQDDQFKGSSLEVRGPWFPETPFEWAILGGTGQFTLAQGILYGNTITVDPQTNRFMKFCFHVFYRPIVKPFTA